MSIQNNSLEINVAFKCFKIGRATMFTLSKEGSVCKMYKYALDLERYVIFFCFFNFFLKLNRFGRAAKLKELIMILFAFSLVGFPEVRGLPWPSTLRFYFAESAHIFVN